jgi:hypothetical protein
MAYRIAGSYVGVCDCSLLCPCPIDGAPTGKDGGCHGAIVWQVREGNLDDTDLSGVAFALYNEFPSNLTSGNWKVGIVVDEGAGDEQAQAIERIVSGQEGGPFADFVPLIGEYLGMERAPVRYSDGDSPSASVGDEAEFSFEPARGGDGSPTTVKNAMFGFAPEYLVGKGSGRSSAFGIGFDEASYGEAAEFEFSSEAKDVHARA